LNKKETNMATKEGEKHPKGDTSTGSDTQTSAVIRVQAYDVDAGTSKQASVAPLNVKSLDEFKKKTLGDIRTLLIAEKVLDSRQ
jgi:hypothetical protein